MKSLWVRHSHAIFERSFQVPASAIAVQRRLRMRLVSNLARSFCAQMSPRPLPLIKWRKTQEVSLGETTWRNVFYLFIKLFRTHIPSPRPKVIKFPMTPTLRWLLPLPPPSHVDRGRCAVGRLTVDDEKVALSFPRAFRPFQVVLHFDESPVAFRKSKDAIHNPPETLGQPNIQSSMPIFDISICIVDRQTDTPQYLVWGLHKYSGTASHFSHSSQEFAGAGPGVQAIWPVWERTRCLCWRFCLLAISSCPHALYQSSDG